MWGSSPAEREEPVSGMNEAAPPARPVAWHGLGVDQVMAALGSAPEGRCSRCSRHATCRSSTAWCRRLGVVLLILVEFEKRIAARLGFTR